MKPLLLIPALFFLTIGIAHALPGCFPLLTMRYNPLADSVGIEEKDGKRFILHRVDQGQTLYAIARRYGQSVADIKMANPDMNESVRYDQVVRIPLPNNTPERKETKPPEKVVRDNEKRGPSSPKPDSPVSTSGTARPAPPRKTDDPARAGIHVVEPGQTLYSLAVRYGIPQADLRRWNNLANDNILIGQALIVSEKAHLDRLPLSPLIPAVPAKPTDGAVRPAPAKPVETKPASTNQPDAKAERPAPRNPDEAAADRRNDAATGTTPERTSRPTVAKPADVDAVELPRAGNDAPMPARGRRVSSSGVAEMIEGAGGSGKYLALHRTAPIGTLVQVSNKFNNQSLWVKVIGRLPNTGVNDKILIKLSAQAFAKLSPEDRRFRAEVSYIVR